MNIDVLTADAHLPREGGATRPVVDVAVGVLLQPDGQFLLTSRPPGKVYAGYWEFPGGKLALGESVEQALAQTVNVRTTLHRGDKVNVAFSQQFAAFR